MTFPMNSISADEKFQLELQAEDLFDAFESAWRDGGRPDWRSFLPENRTLWLHVVSELVRLDCEHRRQLGEHPRATDYPEVPAELLNFCAGIEIGSQLTILEGRPASFLASQFVECHEAEGAPGTPQRSSTGAATSAGAAAPADLPEHLGRYEVRRLLGQGAFATVYLGWDPQLCREVVIKRPRQDREWPASEMERFAAEARTIARLNLPGVAAVYDVFEVAGDWCAVQQYIAGETLRHWMAKQSVPPETDRVIEIVCAVAETVGAAHQQQVIHRDLKPENILIGDDLRVWVIDFGLALHISERSQWGGMVAGSRDYLAPEQVRGLTHKIDARADVWAIGALLYELLTGQRPFLGQNIHEVFDAIKYHEPQPLRQLAPDRPRELERICGKCLAKLPSGRYSTMSDLVEDLKAWRTGDAATNARRRRRGDSNVGQSSGDATSTVGHSVIPKGLRAFEAEDAGFFLDLLPGARDREGLPEIIRFWKSRLESTDPARAFAVGVIYGPSGCGKSSLLKAGLLPHLDERVVVVRIEATHDQTERHLVTALRRTLTIEHSGLGLTDTLAEARLGKLLESDEKLLIVIDQFEQWLHTRRADMRGELLESLRQCDGVKIQTLLLVRDDFWMPVSELFAELDQRLQEGFNTGRVGLFDMPHARMVLTAFGRAHGCLPKIGSPLDAEQVRFLDAAVTELAQDSKVVCVQLALFAEMLRDKSWTPATLSTVGGAEGVGVRFLDETFYSRDTSPRYREVAEPARRVLAELLPEQGSELKGYRRTRMQLAATVELPGDAPEVGSLLQILDGELRLISPVESPEPTREADSSARTDGDACYQLTHDYLVDALRQWLTQKQQETSRGRAQLVLKEQTRLWNTKRHPRNLLSLREFVTATCFVPTREISPTQRSLLRESLRYHASRLAVATTLLLVLAVGAGYAMFRKDPRERDRKISEAIEFLNGSQGNVVPYALRELNEFPREVVMHQLRQRRATVGPPQRLGLEYGLSYFGDVEVHYLCSQISTIPADEVDNLVSALEPERELAMNELSLQAQRADDRRDWRHKTRLGVVALQLGDSRIAADMARVDDRPNPVQRTEFIVEFSKWHGSVGRVARSLQDSHDWDLLGAVCLAMGEMSEEATDLHARDQALDLMDRVERGSETFAANSAARSARRKWNPEIDDEPAVAPAAEGKSWFVNKVGISMVRIPPGIFVRTDLAFMFKQQVTLTKPFYLADREVTVRQFQEFMEDRENRLELKPISWKGPDIVISATPDHPVQRVNWYDALNFCNWLSRKDGRDPAYLPKGYHYYDHVRDANGYRLPTEAEWEWACRAGTDTTFCMGNDVARLPLFAVFNSVYAEPCGSKLPNGWGLFDMVGNVHEWCQDAHADYVGDSVTDPLGDRLNVTHRVAKGGGWRLGTEYCQSIHRIWIEPIDRNMEIGFRVALNCNE